MNYSVVNIHECLQSIGRTFFLICIFPAKANQKRQRRAMIHVIVKISSHRLVKLIEVWQNTVIFVFIYFFAKIINHFNAKQEFILLHFYHVLVCKQSSVKISLIVRTFGGAYFSCWNVWFENYLANTCTLDGENVFVLIMESWQAMKHNKK